MVIDGELVKTLDVIVNAEKKKKKNHSRYEESMSHFLGIL